MNINSFKPILFLALILMFLFTACVSNPGGNVLPPESYTVTFVDWNNDVLATETVAEGVGATAPANPTREGYTFTSWDKAFDNVTEDLSVQAVYTFGVPVTYTVTFVDWNDDVLATETVAEGAGATAPANPTREGYTFTGWDKTFDNVTANLTVQALYTIGDIVTHTVTFVDWDDDVLATETVANGAGATAPSSPTREGYTFTGWDKTFDNVTEDLTVQAEYDANDVNNVVNLGTAANYAILAKTGVSSVPGSAITGNIGVSPAAASYLTGFSETLDVSNSFSTSAQVTGKLYASDYAPPTPVNLTTAVGDMGTAYTDASGRAADYTELYSGSIGGKTLTAGVYKWGNGVLINSDVTLHGGPNDVFIFQIAKGITQANGTRINLTGGVQAQNIFWQAAETVSIGTGAHFEGNILCKTNITMAANSSINGRLLAQTAVTLDQSTVVAPN